MVGKQKLILLTDHKALLTIKRSHSFLGWRLDMDGERMESSLKQELLQEICLVSKRYTKSTQGQIYRFNKQKVSSI